MNKDNNSDKTFIDLLRDEIKSCVKEVLSSCMPALTVAEQLPLTLTVPQFCEQMNVSRTVAYDMINSKGFPAFRVGSKYLINARGLQQWLNRQCNWEE